jgi:predicted TIM-barrel fold metal-dependent hydrolase
MPDMKTVLHHIATRTLLLVLTGITLCFSGFSQDPADILLRNYRPKSIYKIPETFVQKAAFPVIDMHSHAYAATAAEIDEWVKIMDSCGIQKTIVLTMSTGAKFDSLVKAYSKYKDRFDLWCGFDYTGYNTPAFPASAVKELERCHKMGAKGVGELGDKGYGELYSEPVAGVGLHMDDYKMKPLFQKCAELNMPINIHVADPIWMYEKMDSTNDGLMNALEWKIDASLPGLLSLYELVNTLENAVKENPKTIFIACHYANLMHDLDRLGTMLDKYPNFYSDISARYAETATIPRYMKSFIEKHQDKIVYGTDMGFNSSMYRVTFRILETNDEHFYEISQFNYHWPLQGFGLSPEVLRKIYNKNASVIIK